MLIDKNSTLEQLLPEKVNETVDKNGKNESSHYQAPDPYAPQEFIKEQIREIQDLGNSTLYYDCKSEPGLNQILSKHDLPYINVLRITHSKNDPKIFATISRANKQKFLDKELLEYMDVLDYKRLTDARLQEYFAIITKIMMIDKEGKHFPKCIEAFKKEKELTSYIFGDIINPSVLDTVTKENFEEIFNTERLCPKTLDSYDNNKLDLLQISWQDSGDNYSILTRMLKQEEEWDSRIMFLRDIVNDYRQDDKLKSSVDWLEIKIDSLYQLDIKARPGVQIENEEVFNLQQFIKAQSKKSENKSQPNDTYPEEYKTQIKSSYFQPPKIKTYQLNNDNKNSFSYPLYKAKVNIRAKQCYRIKDREAQTDYFIHLWNHGDFGYEKIFEKRINTDGQQILIDSFDFLNDHQYLNLKISSPSQTQMIFNTKAPFKDPILIAYDLFIQGVFSLEPDLDFGIKRAGIDRHCLEQLIVSEKEKEGNTSYQIINALNGELIRTVQLDKWPQKKKVHRQTKIYKQGGTLAVSQIKAPLETEEDKIPKEINFSPLKGVFLVKKELKDVLDKKEFHMSIINKKEYKLPVATFKGTQMPEVYITQDTKQILLQINEGKAYSFKLFEFDSISKSYKEASQKFDPLADDPDMQRVLEAKEYFQVQSRIIPTEDSFFILYPYIPDKKIKCRIYLRGQFLFQSRYSEQSLKIFKKQNKIWFQNINNYSITNNQVVNYNYLIIFDYNELFQKNKDIKEILTWTKSKTRYIFNVEFHSNMPYAFYIYNHDQVYMMNLEDVTQKNKIYYLNSILHIPQTSRPLSVAGIIERNKFRLVVPVLQRDYSLTQFNINIHTLASRKYFTGSFDIQNQIKMSIFSHNEKFIDQITTNYKPKSLELFKDGKPNYNEIMINNDYNSISIGLYKNNKITLKLKVHIMINKKTDEQAKAKGSTDWRTFKKIYFISLMTSKEVIFIIREKLDNNADGRQKPYEIDIQDYYICDVCYDTIDGENFTSYIVMGTKDARGPRVKYFTFTLDQFSQVQHNMEEQKYNLYSISSIQAKNPLQFNQPKSIFACRMIISNQQDDTTGMYWAKQYDSEQKTYCSNTSYNIAHQDTLIQKCISQNGTRLFLFKQKQCNDDVHEAYILSEPLQLAKKQQLNSFNYFIHKSVPLLNEQSFYTTQFTLTSNVRQHKLDFASQLTQPNQDQRTLNKLKYLEPGLLITFRNGQKQIILLSEFGYEFMEIIKYNQSNNGKYVIIGGKLKQPKKGRQEQLLQMKKMYASANIKENEALEGIFLFEIQHDQIELKLAIPYAKPKVKQKTNFNKLDFTFQSLSSTQNNEEQKLEGEEKAQKLKDEEEKKNELENLNSTLLQLFESNKVFTKKNGEYHYLEDELENELNEEFLFEEKLILEKYNQTYRKDLKTFIYEQLLPKYSDALKKQPGLKDEDFISQIEKDGTSNEKLDDDKNKQQQNYQQDQKKSFGQTDFDQQYQLYKSIKDVTFSQIEYEDNGTVFDIPYLFKKLEKDLSTDLLPYNNERYFQQLNQLTHTQMIFKVNIDGKIIIIDRITNTLYIFFYQEGSFECEIKKHQFEREFIIQQADIDENKVVVASFNEYRVYDISKGSTISPNNLLYSSNQYSNDNQKKVQQLQDFEKPKFIILDINIKGDCIMINFITEDTTSKQFFIIFNYLKKTQQLQLNTKAIVSGDKNHVWDKTPSVNLVYDIEHMTHTLFFWNEAKMRHVFEYSGNVFYVNKNRTALVTQGYVQYTYDVWNSYNKNISQDTYMPLNLQFHKFSDKTWPLQFLSDKEWLKKILDFFKYIETVKNHHVETFKKDENWINDHFTYFLLSYYYPANEKPIEENQDQVLAVAPKNSKKQKEEEKIVDKTGFSILKTLFKIEGIKPDIIEEILKILIKSNSPILIKQVNSVFVELLNLKSQSFQEYIEKTSLQTEQMKDIDKFFIKDDLKNGEIFFCTNQIVVDRDFYLKHKNNDIQTKKEVEISYIEIGDILINEQGKQIMGKLSQEDNLEKMSLPFIEKLVLYQWNSIKSNIYKRLFYPFIINLFLFSFYATFQVSYVQKLKQDLQEDLSVYFINILSLLTVLSYFFYMEIKQFIQDPGEYFRTVWNLADLITILLCYSVIFLDLIGIGHSVNKKLASICVLILWIKFFYFLRIFDQTAFLIRMITEIVNDMRNFLIVLIIAVFGFANGFFILLQGHDDIMGQGIWEALIYSYRMALGDFQLDEIGQLDQSDMILFWILFIIASLFVVIVLLNLLIAIMGDTFGRVNENITNLSIREKAMLVDENEHLFNRAKLFQDSKYLVVIKDASFQQSSLQNWDGQINSMKRQVVEQIDKFKKEMDQQLIRNEISVNDVKKKLNENEDKTTKNHDKLLSMFGNLSKDLTENFDKKQQLTLEHLQKEFGGIKQQLEKIERKNFVVQMPSIDQMRPVAVENALQNQMSSGLTINKDYGLQL